ncbi:unnamed protein product [Anisakis simplex]|uniref:Probable ATP-dependent RNA helicase DHX35 homolog (inferred by orthology to a C. elegans protein) n=1 Tax=Anisakis simplex TaxID=6269 RepID=A0A0M3J5Y6_ANISI|nr:unnamed protein product [Anisakis simplex]
MDADQRRPTHAATSANRKPRFIRPSDDDVLADDRHKGPLVLEERAAESSVEVDLGCSIVYNNPYVLLSIQQQRSRLPIFKNRNHILYLLEKYRTVIIVGETGCGKSTQIPQVRQNARCVFTSNANRNLDFFILP